MMSNIVIIRKDCVENLNLLIHCLRTTRSDPITVHASRVNAELSRLPDPDQSVLRARFGVADGRCALLEDVAASHPPMTANRVRLVEARGLATLRRRLTE
jgi:DNA-directed RNA polymerase sigma subunit (sigma70/sigma32)